jgi:hypothetical protein
MASAGRPGRAIGTFTSAVAAGTADAASDEEDVGPLAGGLFGDSAADPGARAGREGDLPCE